MNPALPRFTADQVGPALSYIDEHWRDLTRYRPHDEASLIGLPRPYVVPSHYGSGSFAFEELYYWDSYFMAQGLFGTKREKLAFDMLDDLLYLQKRFGVIPNGSRYYLTSRSQPPFLTSYILEVYNRGHKSRHWLDNAMAVAQNEYLSVWMGNMHPHWRQVFCGLSRYYDTSVLHDLAENESGWDMNPRFNGECLSYLPIDLNALLFKYEKDFEVMAGILGHVAEAKHWAERAAERLEQVNKYLWNQTEGFYFDYNYVTGRPSKVWSLAAYFPLWAGMCSPEQANLLVQNLAKFEAKGGLTTTSAESQSQVPRQWEYPNGWAPLHWITVHGLMRYHKREAAERIARKWLAANLDEFGRSQTFLEKYNVVDPALPPKEGVYPSQRGFGWSNAVFYRFAHDFLTLAELPQKAKRSRLPRLNIVTGKRPRPSLG